MKKYLIICNLLLVHMYMYGQEHDNYIILSKEQPLIDQIQTAGHYILFNDFDLNGSTIYIPENSTFLFEGGSISNGLLVCGSNSQIKNAVFHNLEVDVRGVSGVRIIESRFIYKTAQRTDCAIYINNAANVSIKGCVFNLVDSLTSIKILESNNIDVNDCIIDGGRDVDVLNRDLGGGVFILYSSHNINVSNNRINNVGIGVSIQGLGSDENRMISDIIVHGNTINNCRCYGIIAYYGKTSCSNIVITDNIISGVTGQYNNIATTPSRSLGGGIYLQQVSRVICTGNIIRNVAINTNNNSTLAPAGIAIATSSHCKVTNNLIEDCQQQGIILRGDFNTICENTIINSCDIPLEFRAGNGNVIKANHFISGNSVKGPSIYCRQHGNDNSMGVSNTIGDNIIEGNIIEGRQIPIYCHKVEGVLRIKDNILSNFSGVGIEVTTGFVIITGNVIKSSLKKSKGLSIETGASGYSKDNFIITEGSPVSVSNRSSFKELQ